MNGAAYNRIVIADYCFLYGYGCIMYDTFIQTQLLALSILIEQNKKVSNPTH